MSLRCYIPWNIRAHHIVDYNKGLPAYTIWEKLEIPQSYTIHQLSYMSEVVPLKTEQFYLLYGYFRKHTRIEKAQFI